MTRQRKRRASLRRPSTLDWEGFLWKRGGGTSTLFSSSAFARRYFVLDGDGDLFYYQDVAARHAGTNLKRPFKVRGCTVQRGDLTVPNARRRLSVKIAGGLQSTSDHLVFSIRPADEKSRTLALCAETEEERDHWIRVLRTASLLPLPSCELEWSAPSCELEWSAGSGGAGRKPTALAVLAAQCADPNAAGGALSALPRLLQLLRAPDVGTCETASGALLHLALHVGTAQRLLAAGAISQMLLHVRPATAREWGPAPRSNCLQALRLLAQHRGCCTRLWRLGAPSRVSVLVSRSVEILYTLTTTLPFIVCSHFFFLALSLFRSNLCCYRCTATQAASQA